jgi:hypothetical protein
MKITNVEVHGLEDAILASGFAFRSDFDPEKMDDQKKLLSQYLAKYYDTPVSLPMVDLSDEEEAWCAKQIRRMKTLGSCAGGESHDCALCGITVSFNMTCPRLVMPEVQRYHFMDIVTASSTMHYLKRNVNAMLEDPSKIDQFFCPYTDRRVVNVFLEVAKELLDKLPEDKNQWDEGTNELVARLKAILPEGYLQTTRIVTNYRQLKTWIRQRSNHPLQEWRDVCKWIHTLPLFDELTARNEQ